MVKKIVIFSFLALTLLGCEDDNEKNNSKYAGVWSDGSSDYLMVIMDNGDVVGYRCSFNSGYIPNSFNEVSRQVVGDDFIVSYGGEIYIGILDIQNNMLVLTDQSEEAEEPVYFERLDSLPETCESSAIEISYISTTDVYEGEDTTFTIDFNYRLAEPTGIIRVYFLGENDSFVYPEENSIDVTEITSGNSSITLNHGAVELTDAAPYYIYIMMSSEEPDAAFSFDRRLLTIHKN